MKALRYNLATLWFYIRHTHHGFTFWFPRRLKLEVTHIPTIDEAKTAKEPLYVRGVLSFTHGFPWNRGRAEVKVYKMFSIFAPQYWRFASTGVLTPGFIVERLEQRWCEQRQAMNVQIQFQSTGPN